LQIYESTIFYLPDPPVISLELGSKLQPGDIKEGDDVYFECKIEANPKFRKLQWLHNVSKYWVWIFYSIFYANWLDSHIIFWDTNHTQKEKYSNCFVRDEY
jgi:hypothetical protein